MTCREIEHRIASGEDSQISGDPKLMEHVLGCFPCRELTLGARTAARLQAGSFGWIRLYVSE